MVNDFFPPRPTTTPTVYAFASTHPDDAGLLKVASGRRRATSTGCRQKVSPWF